MSRSRDAAYPWLIALVVAFAVVGFRDLGWLQSLELEVYDTLLEGEPLSASSDVVLIEITEQDIAEQGHWPLSDRVLAEAQASLLASPQYRHPYYWAPFLVINNWL